MITAMHTVDYISGSKKVLDSYDIIGIILIVELAILIGLMAYNIFKQKKK